MVKMHVRQHDVANSGGVHAAAAEHFFDWGQDHATWTPSSRRRRVHPQCPQRWSFALMSHRASDHPNEIVERHERVMNFVAMKFSRADRFWWAGVAQRQHFVGAACPSEISPGKAGGFKDVSRSKRLGGDADAAPELEPPEGGFFSRGRWRSN